MSVDCSYKVLVSGETYVETVLQSSHAEETYVQTMLQSAHAWRKIRCTTLTKCLRREKIIFGAMVQNALVDINVFWAVVSKGSFR